MYLTTRMCCCAWQKTGMAIWMPYAWLHVLDQFISDRVSTVSAFWTWLRFWIASTHALFIWILKELALLDAKPQSRNQLLRFNNSPTARCEIVAHVWEKYPTICTNCADDWICPFQIQASCIYALASIYRLTQPGRKSQLQRIAKKICKAADNIRHLNAVGLSLLTCDSEGAHAICTKPLKCTKHDYVMASCARWQNWSADGDTMSSLYT